MKNNSFEASDSLQPTKKKKTNKIYMIKLQEFISLSFEKLLNPNNKNKCPTRLQYKELAGRANHIEKLFKTGKMHSLPSGISWIAGSMMITEATAGKLKKKKFLGKTV